MTNKEQRAVWQEAAQRLRFEGPGLIRGLQLDGTVDGFQVRVTESTHRFIPVTRIVVHGEAQPIIRSIEPREGYYQGLTARFAGGDDVESGDPLFDKSAIARGDPHKVAALLDVATRRAILHVIGGGIRLADGIVTRLIPRRITSSQRLASAIRATVALTRRLTANCDVPARLASNARHDPVAGVRLNNLRQLMQSFPDQAKAILKPLTRDRDPNVRLCAALALKEKGQSTLRSLAMCQQLDGRSQARALAALAAPLAVRPAIRVLNMAFGSDRRTVALAAIKMLGQRGGPQAIARLTALLDDADAETVVAACLALETARAVAAAPALRQALGSEWPEVRSAGARALGSVGAASAVPALHAAAAAFPFDIGLRRAANEAIALIQSRLKGAEHGQLSLAEGDRGRVSLSGSDPAKGRVSLAEAEGKETPAKRGQRPKWSQS